MANELSLSVIIPNYNYGDYVGAAIRSALRINWPKVEVIVVDDGSTDHSREEIGAFAADVITIYQENVGQMPSCVNGFMKSSGDIIIFLDSDDILHEDVMTEIESVWSESASKFQYQMRMVDRNGYPTGSVLPQFFRCPTPKDIRKWVTTTGAYPTPPGSGNAYPRWFVDRVFSFKSDFSDRAPDSYLVAAAPAFGDVVTIPKPLVDYRVHGLNHGASLFLDDSRFAREVDLTRRRHNYFVEIANSVGLAVAKETLNRNLIYLCLRAASFGLRPDIHPVPNDSSKLILLSSFSALAYPQGFTISQRFLLFIWIYCVTIGPRRFRSAFVSWRYVPAARPKLIRVLLRMGRALRSSDNYRAEDGKPEALQKQAPSSGPLTLSVIIPNYNYAHYVGSAIKSALKIRWPAVEIVVVDDGSTDGSLDVINAFSADITVIAQAKVGQLTAVKSGFRESSGNVVIILDADDMLHPDVMEEIASAWSDDASKYQFQMRLVDAMGNPTGSILPQYFSHPTSQDIRAWAADTGGYPTPPGSGNAYPRWFVERVFNCETDFEDRAPDSYLITAAPALGQVITIPRPLVDYRIHGSNQGAALAVDSARFTRELERTRRRFKFFAEIARSVDLPVAVGALDRNLIYLCLRAASYALRPDHILDPNESAGQILILCLKALAHRQGFSFTQSFSLFLWVLLVLLGPKPVQRSMVRWRYVPTTRPNWLWWAMNIIGLVR